MSVSPHALRSSGCEVQGTQRGLSYLLALGGCQRRVRGCGGVGMTAGICSRGQDPRTPPPTVCHMKDLRPQNQNIVGKGQRRRGRGRGGGPLKPLLGVQGRGSCWRQLNLGVRSP